MYIVLCLELLAVLLLCVCVCVLGGGWYQTDFFFAVLNGADYSHISNGCGQLHLLHKCPIWADTFINALNYDKIILFLFWEYTLHILFTFITFLSNSFCHCNTYAHCYRRYYVHSQSFKKCLHWCTLYLCIYVIPMNRIVFGNKQYKKLKYIGGRNADYCER